MLLFHRNDDDVVHWRGGRGVADLLGQQREGCVAVSTVLWRARTMSADTDQAAVLASSLIVFAAFRNTVTWHLQRFWGASADFWQSQWDWLLDNYCEDERVFWTVGTTVITFSAYWIVGGFYIFMDVTGRPSFFRKYKVQPGTNEPVSNKQLFKAIGQVLFNQFAISIPMTYLGYSLIAWRSPPLRELPTFHWVLFELLCLILLEEIGFYYTHRLMHHRLLYRHMHKQHHEWTSPISITAIYSHPVEHVVSNLAPIFLAVVVMGSHVATAWLWFLLATINTLNDHSGYHLPFLSSPEYHDYHHLKFHQCYGVLGLLDRLHGTDSEFRNSKAYTRHLTILTASLYGADVTDFWQKQWDNFLDVVGEDQKMLWVVGTSVVTTGVFWGIGALYLILDVLNKPAAMRRYKIQAGTNEPVANTKLMGAIGQILFNQIAVGIPLTYAAWPFLEWRGLPNIRILPSFHVLIYEIICFVFVVEIGFYYSHRLLHHRLLYKYIHKQHHEWTAPIAITAEYCHPIEHIFSNVLPILMGPLLLGSHMVTTWIWFTLALLSTLNDHSGFNQCYGVLGLLDWYHGTDSGFRQTHQFKRHRILTGLNSERVEHHGNKRQDSAASKLRYWHAGGLFVEQQWTNLIDFSGLDDFHFWVFGTTSFTMSVYWLCGISYVLMDLTGRPKMLRKYKVQQGTNEPLDPVKLKNALTQVLFNQIVVSIPLAYIGGIVKADKHPPLREIPSFGRVLTDFAVCLMVYEIGFYYSHRLLHHPSLYKHLHKQHHEWTAPIAITAIYCHPIEYVFGNVMPQFVGISLMRSHTLTAWLWLAFVIINTLVAHSGYHLPFLRSPELHDYHHQKFDNCYGIIGFLDWLHGTDDKFRATKNYDRNHVILGLASARELHPDMTKKQN
ncbi:hypothetical protein B566_EDAN011566 [Ephemera danica]|nr:hypothetical protein B566_EDAN011566 [Ephemera danica]